MNAIEVIISLLLVGLFIDTSKVRRRVRALEKTLKELNEQKDK